MPTPASFLAKKASRKKLAALVQIYLPSENTENLKDFHYFQD